METRNYLMGLYGEPPGQINEEIRKKALGTKEPITCRPADLLKPGMDKARTDAGSLARNDDDVLSYALFPEIAKEFFLQRDGQGRAAASA
jgi:pyruvate/oxaloacetate carboxyltransferase